MDGDQKIYFATSLENRVSESSKKDGISLIDATYPNLIRQLQGFVTEDQFPVLAAFLKQFKKEEEYFNSGSSTSPRLEDAILKNEISKKDVLNAFMQLDDTQKERFFSTLAAQELDENQIGIVLECIRSILPELAKREIRPVNLLLAMAGMPALVGQEIIIYQHNTAFADFFNAFWPRFSSDEAANRYRQSFMEGCLKVIKHPKNIAESHNIFRMTFDNYQKASFEIPVLIKFVMASEPEILAQTMGYYKAADILDRIITMLPMMTQEGGKNFLKALYGYNKELFKQIFTLALKNAENLDVENLKDILVFNFCKIIQGILKRQLLIT